MARRADRPQIVRNLRWLAGMALAGMALAGCTPSTPGPQEAGSTQPASQQPEPAAATATADTAGSGLPDRDPQLAKKLVREGAVLLDVRTQQEWDEGHVEGAQLIPVQELSGRMAEVEKLTGGDKSKPVVVYCKSGGRAGRAKKMLLEAGYTQVTNMGGYSDWPKD